MVLAAPPASAVPETDLEGCEGRVGLRYVTFGVGPSTAGTCDSTHYVMAPGHEGEVPSPTAGPDSETQRDAVLLWWVV